MIVLWIGLVVVVFGVLSFAGIDGVLKDGGPVPNDYGEQGRGEGSSRGSRDAVDRANADDEG